MESKFARWATRLRQWATWLRQWAFVGPTVGQDAEAGRDASSAERRRLETLAEAGLRNAGFLARMSHELRAPLNVILGWSQLLQGETLDPTARRHALKMIEKSAKSQARLLEELLDVSRIISGRLRLDMRPVPWGAVIAAAVDTVRRSAAEKGVELQPPVVPPSGHVWGDPNRLQQAVANVLAAAVQASPVAGRVTIASHSRADVWELTIGDSGPPLAADVLARMLDLFYDDEGSGGRLPSGLGVPLARHLVELHQGVFEASSDDASGTTYCLRLPVYSCGACKSSSTPKPGADVGDGPLGDGPLGDGPLGAFRVVAVDDDPGSRELLQRILSQCGVQVTLVATAKDALAAVRRLRPDLLLSDLTMPVEDGFWLIRQVRSLPLEYGGDTPAIALTAASLEELTDPALAAGFQRCLRKAVEPRELVAAIALVVESGRRAAAAAVG